jgi:hypothetical protein
MAYSRVKTMTPAIISLTLTKAQHDVLLKHVLDPDGKEGAAILLCGRAQYKGICRFVGYSLHLLPHADCTRTETSVTWPTRLLEPLLDEAEKKGLAIVKIHSHRINLRRFSDIDDASDAELFPSIYSWLDDRLPHGSAIVLSDGKIIFRVIADNGLPISGKKTMVVGENLRVDVQDLEPALGAANASDIKNAQAFGPGTISILKSLRVGVVGCSGTGAPLIEQLARLGVGNLVLVDPDYIEERNLNRIPHSTMGHVASRAMKVTVLADAVNAIGLGVTVEPHATTIADSAVLHALSTCDVLFGCMDSLDGRHILNRLATFYSIPFIDIGVRLEADGKGGVSQICGSINYLQPGKSTLMSRNVYTADQLRASHLLRSDPKRLEGLVREKYISGVTVERPAVISVNFLYSALAVNELLARIHDFRTEPNEDFAQLMFSLTNGQIFSYSESEFPDKTGHEKYVGRGDMNPILNMVI